MSFFSLGVQSETSLFKIQNVTVGKDVTKYKINNKSSPQFIRLMAERSAKQSNCSLHLTLRTPCGSSRDKESHFFCRSATWTFLRIFRVIIYRNVTKLLKPSLSWLARKGTLGMSVTQLTPISICPRHRPLLGRFYRVLKSCQVTSLAGKHARNFQMAVEICFWFW